MIIFTLPTLCLAVVGIAAERVKLTVPDTPAAGTQTLTGSFQGYSMELASYPALAGNLSAPNKLSYRMLQNLKDISGSAVPIRVGGTTSNHAYWAPNQKEAIIQNFVTAAVDKPAQNSADQPANVTYGPSYLESFKVFPRGTKYTMGVTFDSGKKGEDKSLVESKVFYDGIGRDLHALEVGNEFDVLPVDRNKTTYDIRQYVPEWRSRTAVIADKVLSRKNKKMFQAGPFVAPGVLPLNSTWSVHTALDLGIASQGISKAFSSHHYFGENCSPFKPTVARVLMNRTRLVDDMRFHRNASAYTVSLGLAYVLGETNSIACQGATNVSDVFGAALWSVDYAFYAASLNVSKIFWHMGTGYRYAPWQATQSGTVAPGPRPLYYGNWLIATALGKTDAQVVPIVNTTKLAGYAVYSSGRHRVHLQSLVLVNMDIFNSTSTPARQRSSVDFELPDQLAGKNAKATVRRLTAPGIEAKEGLTFSGRSVALDGKIVGKDDKERVIKGVVNVKASEAVVVSFD